MSGSQDTGDRNLDPTDQRIEEFRKQGRFAKARDAGGIAATAAVLFFLSASNEQILETSSTLFQRTLGDVGALERLGAPEVLRQATMALGGLCGGAVIVAAMAAATAGVAQAKFKTYSELLSPDLNKLNPIGAIGKMFSFKRAGTETLLSIARVVIVGFVAQRALKSELPMLLSLSRTPISAAMPALLRALGHVAAAATGALVLIAAADYLQSWFTLSREMMMTRKEQEDESKQSDGDPKQKAKLKARARALAKKRTMNAVKNADVIVTNPTHVAVALRYGPKDPAPVVIAKGHDEIALRIRAEGRKHNIPILENRRLARALDAEVAIGKPVPAAHFAAVARVLAYVYRLRGNRRKPAAPAPARPVLRPQA